ncbi:MFS transporter [Streptomyces sp. ISL-11]|uniref:MFS transporter n=1 Tax=Streptomyces sp. ISL-11 TaxID=2819174 RepID=UPI001BE561D4|nr:MFS transporter [Streptomyces sp. ISL-11]MBT2382929.1 MFS transporter [Streptomyces sp. ISL-11]
MRTLRAVRESPLALRLLFINQFGVDIGFYLLIPFLAAYLKEDLGLSAALVGLVLSVRNLSQQGLFVLGGTASDRVGARTVIIAGCALRTVAFALLAFGYCRPLLLGASVLCGLAGALFYPAVRTYVAQEAGERKTEVFALLNVFSTSGSLVGLLLGGLLLLTDFRVAALVTTGVFTALTVAQALALPPRRVAAVRETVLRGWREVLGNRRFVCFCSATASLFILENQLYVLLPDGARQASGWGGSAGLLLASGAVATLLFQFRITRTLERRGGGARWVAAGIALMGLGFVPPLLVCGAEPPESHEVVPRLLVMTTGSLLLYFGGMVAYPSVMELIPRFGRERLTGTYFGLFYVLSGTTAAGGNAVVGWAMDLADRTRRPWLPWLTCLFFGLASALAVTWLYRARALPSRPGPAGRPRVPRPGRGPDAAGPAGPARAPDDVQESPPR